MLFLKIAITKQNKLSKICNRRIVAYLLQVIVTKFEGQGLKNCSVIQKVLPRCKDLSACPLTTLPHPLNSLPRPFTSLSHSLTILPQVLPAQL